MPNKIVEDKMVRFVRVEHTCPDGRWTYRGYTVRPESDGGITWGRDGSFCQHCGEKLPMTIQEAVANNV